MASPDPMSARAILSVLKAQFGMTRLKKRDVNSTLYASPTYETVPGSRPPRWFIRGIPANRQVAVAAPAGDGSPYSLLCDVAPVAVIISDAPGSKKAVGALSGRRASDPG